LQKEDKKEFVDLLDKFTDFEKHTTNLLKLLDDRSKVTKKELDAQFATLRADILAEVKKASEDIRGEAATDAKALGEVEENAGVSQDSVQDTEPSTESVVAENLVVERELSADAQEKDAPKGRFFSRFKKGS